MFYSDVSACRLFWPGFYSRLALCWQRWVNSVSPTSWRSTRDIHTSRFRLAPSLPFQRYWCRFRAFLVWSMRSKAVAPPPAASYVKPEWAQDFFIQEGDDSYIFCGHHDVDDCYRRWQTLSTNPFMLLLVVNPMSSAFDSCSMVERVKLEAVNWAKMPSW